jgi:hypothetical protein
VSTRAKPFIHPDSYYTSIGGKQGRLCPVEDGLEPAEEELRKLQSERFLKLVPAPPLVFVRCGHRSFARTTAAHENQRGLGGGYVPGV